MATYTETEATLNIIVQRSSGLIQRANNLLPQVQSLQSDIAKMQTDYSGFATQLNTDAANNASDQNWQDAKAKKDKYVAEFVALKARVDAMVTALTGL